MNGKNSACALPAGAVTVFSWEQALCRLLRRRALPAFLIGVCPIKMSWGRLWITPVRSLHLIALYFQKPPQRLLDQLAQFFYPERAWAVNFAYGDHMSSMRADLLGVGA